MLVVVLEIRSSTQTFYENDEVLSKLIQDEKYVRLIRAINHTEDHKYSVIDKSKRNWFPNDGLLKIWLRLLSFKIPESILMNYKMIMIKSICLIICTVSNHRLFG